MIDDEITDENYCDWRQSNCRTVASLRADLAKTERDCMLMARDANDWKARAQAAEARADAAEMELRSTDPNYTPLLDKYTADIQAYEDRALVAEARVKELEQAEREYKLEIDQLLHEREAYKEDAERLRLAAEKAVEAMGSFNPIGETVTEVDLRPIRAARAGLMESMEKKNG